MSPLFQRASAIAIGSVTNIFTDRPWRSRTVRFAALVAVIGIGFWLKHAFQSEGAPNGASTGGGVHFDRPIPGYVRMAVSYIGGFLIGWTFRRFVKITLIVVASIVVWLGIAKFAGCDTTAFRQRIEHDAETAKEKAAHERDYLKGLLPSGTAAGLGVFWGFWRRSRGMALSSPPDAVNEPLPPAEKT